jgi:regulator-associated protein of mTOR
MSILQRQQNPLGIPRSLRGYEESYVHGNGNGNGAINESILGGGADRSHPMDEMYLDDSKTLMIPPYLRVLPNNGTGNGNEKDLLQKDGSSGAASANGKDNHENAPTSEEADAAAGVSTATSVLKKVTSLGAMVSSTSLSALASIGASDETAMAPSSNSTTPILNHAAMNNNKNENVFSSSPSKVNTMMLNQYYQTSNEYNILNNPNHRNYHHHLYLRNMNVDAAKIQPNRLLGAPSTSIPSSIPPIIKPSWRLRDRMKTVGVGLIMALNVGTDPPDIVKPHPSAKLQCWMDPSSVTRAKAKEKIGDRLEKQYARWQQQRNTSSSSRPFKYRKALDPTVEDVRALCLWLRKQARQERILLHYNGHGVPKPTPNGEIWVFDKNHTEYIPLAVSDLRQWVGKPTIVILDCSSAGVLVPFLTAPPAETPTNTPPRVSSPILAGGSATSALEQQQQQQAMMMGRDNGNDDPVITTMDEAASHWVKDTIVLCPTSEDEWLPMNPEYPADIFTSCLTTPIQMALRWFVRNNRISMGVLFGGGEHNHHGQDSNSHQHHHYNHIGDDGPDISVDSIPGQANDRKTPLGELNWIFTSVTDSIAWNGT